MSKQNRKSFRYWLWQNHFKLSSNSTEAGGSLIIALSLGVLMIGGTTTMLFTSNQNKTNAISDEMSVRAQEVAELGITRVQNFLAKNSQLAEYPLEQWSTVSSSTTVQGTFSNTSSANQTCTDVVSSSSNTLTSTIPTNINDFQNGQAVDPSKLNRGGFQLSDYVVKDSSNQDLTFSALQTARSGVSVGQPYAFVEMIIRGSLNPNADSITDLLTDNSAMSSKSQIRVLIPLIKPDPSSLELPGVWINDQSISSPDNSQIDATLLAPSCDNIGLKIRPDNNVILSNVTFPPLPPEPTENPNYYNLGNLTSNITLPRSTDEPTRTENFLDKEGRVITDTNGNPYVRKVYEYRVDNINFSGTETLKIIPGRKVILHLHGNITLGGGQTIKNTCTTLANNYQCDTSTKVVTYNSTSEKSLYRNSNLVILGRQQKTATNNPTICLNGGSQIFGFVFAPDYAVGAAGTGGGNGFIGAVWARLFNPPSNCGSNTGQVVAIQEIDDWNELGMGESFVPGNLPPRISTVSQWERRGVN